jgi:hypothetical protein
MIHGVGILSKYFLSLISTSAWRSSPLMRALRGAGQCFDQRFGSGPAAIIEHEWRAAQQGSISVGCTAQVPEI